MLRLLAALLVGLALLAGSAADARLTVNNLTSFGARVRTAVGADTVTYLAAAAYEDTATNGTNGTWDYTYTVTHTKGATTDFILVAFNFEGVNQWLQWPTGGIGTRVLYCGSAMTFVTGSPAFDDTSGADNDNVYTEWWYLRGPTSGACTIEGDIERTTGSGGTGGAVGDSTNAVTFHVMEFSGVKSSGTPYEGVNTASVHSGTTHPLTLTPTLGQTAVWSFLIDPTASIPSGACVTVDFGSCDAFFYDSVDIFSDTGHYQAAGAKTITATIAVSRVSGMSGFHLLGN